MFGGTSPHIPIGIGQLRGHDYLSNNLSQILTPLFHNLDTGINIEIKGRRAEEEDDRILSIKPITHLTFHPETIKSDKVIERISENQKNPPISGLELSYANSKGKVFTSFLKRDSQTGNLDYDWVWRDDFTPNTMISTFARPSYQTLSILFSELKLRKAEDVVLDAIQIIEPSIKKIDVISGESGSSLFADIGIDKRLFTRICG